jgi:site-specific recombinase XerC
MTWLDPLDGGQLAVFHRSWEGYAKAWAVSIRHPKTRSTYLEGFKQWVAFCDRMGFDPMRVGRPQIELWLLHLEQLGRKPRTIVNRLCAIRSFYSYCVDEEILDCQATGAWTPEKARLFSSAHSLCLARDSMDPTLIAVAEWWRDRARRAFLRSFYALDEVPRA